MIKCRMEARDLLTHTKTLRAHPPPGDSSATGVNLPPAIKIRLLKANVRSYVQLSHAIRADYCWTPACEPETPAISFALERNRRKKTERIKKNAQTHLICGPQAVTGSRRHCVKFKHS